MSYFKLTILKQLISHQEFKNRPHKGGWMMACVLMSLSLLLSACSPTSSETGNSSNPSSSATKITVSSGSVFLSETGNTFQLTATLTDSNGVALATQPTFTWASDSDSIATVNQSGLLTAMAFGETKIQVTSGDLSNSINVTINNEISTLIGHVMYEDKEYASSGFITRTDYFKTVRYAKVELISGNGVDVEQTIYTDDAGNFTFSGILNSQQSIVVTAMTDVTVGLNLKVEDRSSVLYAVSKSVDLTNLNNFVIKITKDTDAAGAFNILDASTNAAQFALANTDLTIVSLASFWEPDNSDGTYFCTGYDSLYCKQGEGVYIFNSVTGDTDEFDDDVLYHEFGHYFTDILSRDDSFGGCHLLSSTDLDLRLAWSEGVGDFFPAVIKQWLSEPDRKHLLSTEVNLPVTAYVDTYGSSAQIYIDMATMSQTRYSSAANEMAVAKILWTLSQQYGMPAVVKVMTDYLPTIGSLSVNLESFWDGWLSVHNPTPAELLALESIYGERLVYYREDSYESDNVSDTERKAVLGVSEKHYLYSKSLTTDLDVIAFDVDADTQYTVSTSGLTSGADTHLRILHSSATPLAIGGVEQVNDDPDPETYYAYDSTCGSSRYKNSGSALASSVTFIAPDTGTYYAEIRTTPDPEPYLSAGRYGTYDFKVNQN